MALLLGTTIRIVTTQTWNTILNKSLLGNRQDVPRSHEQKSHGNAQGKANLSMRLPRCHHVSAKGSFQLACGKVSIAIVNGEVCLGHVHLRRP